MTATIKKAVFSVFGEEQLPTIDIQAGPSEIRQWKTDPSIKRYYEKLFTTIKADIQTIYMSRVLKKVWPDVSKALDTHIAYAISVCKTLLDPSINGIQIISSIESKIKRNMVSFIIF